MTLRLLFLCCLSMLIQSCSTADTIKREPLALPVSKDFDLEGHLKVKPKISDSKKGEAVAPIPSLIDVQAINVNPMTGKSQKLYSVSAINVPASDLLYTLSVDAHKQLDLSSDVKGKVTINAINQPLETILKRVSEQLGAIYEVSHGTISISPDEPYWHTYQVDYVNVSKNVQDNTVMKMSVGNVGSDSTGSSGNEASEFKMQVSSNNDFWGVILNNLTSMAAFTQNFSAEAAMSAPTASATTPAPSAQAATSAVAADGSTIKNVVINREAGLVSVYTTGARQQKIKHYLEGVGLRTSKQVLIEATVVEVELNDQYQAGVDWSAVGGNNTASQTTIGKNFISPNAVQAFTLGLGGGAFNLQMLQQFGKTKVLSSPKIMAMNNQSAMLKVVDNQVYFTIDVSITPATTTSAQLITTETTVHTVPVGFMMNMTPFISDDGKITINIRPTLSRIVKYVNDPSPALSSAGIVSQIPVVQEREMDSVLKLRNKQTAIIGGLIQDTHTNERQSVPVLGSIPWVGDLFSYRSDQVKKTELIIFIRPIIIENPDIDNGDLKDMQTFLKTQKN